MDRLLLALVDGDVGRVEISSVMGVANGIKPTIESWNASGRLGEDDTTTFLEGFNFYRERSPAGNPFPF